MSMLFYKYFLISYQFMCICKKKKLNIRNAYRKYIHIHACLYLYMFIYIHVFITGKVSRGWLRVWLTRIHGCPDMGFSTYEIMKYVHVMLNLCLSKGI